MTMLRVARAVRSSGQLEVDESPDHILRLIASAKRHKNQFITLTKNGLNLELKYSLINSIGDLES